MTAQDWLAQELASLQDDPEYLTEKLLIELTERIDHRMKELGVRPAELARRLGVSRAAVSQMLSGHPNMTIQKLVTVAHALDSTVQFQITPRADSLRTSLMGAKLVDITAFSMKMDVDALFTAA